MEKIEKSGNIFGKKINAPISKGEKTVLLGCRLLERTEDGQKYLAILRKLGIKLKTFDETCCGMPFAVLGEKKGFAKQQEKFMKSIPKKDEDVICVCTTCAFFIQKKYP